MSSYSDYARLVGAIHTGKGRAQAAGHLRSGQIWGSTIQGLGQIAAEIPGQWAEHKRQQDEQQRQEAQQAQIQAIFEKTGGDLDAAFREITLIDPELGMRLQKEKSVADKAVAEGRAAVAKGKVEALDFLTNRLHAVKTQDDYTRELYVAGSIYGPEAIQQMPPEYQPELVERMLLATKEARDRMTAEKPQAMMNVAAGGAVFDPVTRMPVFENTREPTPAPPAQPYTLSPGQQRFGADNQPLASVEARPLASAGQAGSDGGDPGLVKAVMANPSLWASLPASAKERIGPALAEQGFSDFGPAPSALERMDARKFEKAAPVLAAMVELSEKINTGQGVVAKVSGAVERAKAQANLNDDVAEYQSLIEGFTPMVARALGHTGVLTQQDVDSVRNLFPKPGDSKSLRDRKVARVMTIVGQLQAADGKAPTPPGAPVAVPPVVGGLPSYEEYRRSRQGAR